MELAQLNNLVDVLAVNRKLKDELEERIGYQRNNFEESISKLTGEVATLKETIEANQSEILAALKETDTKNWKTEKATVTRKSTKSYKVSDKNAVFTYLKEKGLESEYTVQELAPHIKGLYETTEVPGVETIEKEFISVLLK